jgi:MFS superfamily sulfate permease-like transporter
VHTGFKLVNIDSVKRLMSYGRMPVAIYFVTLITIVAVDLLTGVIAGIALSILKLFYAFTRLSMPVRRDDSKKIISVEPVGAITFVRLPQLATLLESVPPGYELHIDVERMTYIDHACLEMLANWETQEAANGKSLVVEWDDVAERSWHQGQKLARATGAVSEHH